MCGNLKKWIHIRLEKKKFYLKKSYKKEHTIRIIYENKKNMSNNTNYTEKENIFVKNNKNNKFTYICIYT